MRRSELLVFVAMRPVGKPVHNVYPFVQLQTDSSLADCSLQHMYALRSELLVFVAMRLMGKPVHNVDPSA